jgi:uncharacterized protein (DUF924 family)
MQTTDAILQFWFGDEADDLAVNRAKAALWWGKSPEQDAQITDRFADTLAAAAAGQLDAWANSARACLALIITLDQFPRVIHRNSPDAFACDAHARALTVAGLARGFDRELRHIERVFFYLPLEHSEQLADQDASVARYQALADSAPPAHKQLFTNTLDFAHRHRDIIVRFGRFPHRNAILQRQSTPEEIDFLTQAGSSF